ncbi:MAG: SGNH/GDSL hydrolase family protein [Paracoccaceae bacterium]
MKRPVLLAAGAALLATLAGALWWRMGSAPPVPVLPGLDDATMATLYATPLPAADQPLSVFHIGHSLVNRDMPAMLAQLAGDGHRYESQLGWGAQLQSHWGDSPVNGFEAENAHPRYRDAREAVSSGDYDAIVLTEMVEIRDALRYFDSARYLAQFADTALAARPDVRIYLYETWHPLNDPEGWLERIDADLARYWEAGILRPALLQLPEGSRIYLIPAGQALAALVRTIEAQGGVGNVKDRRDLFSDDIHLNDLGNYFIALVHYAVLYGSSPEGLPHELMRADGTAADAPAPETARLMQQIAWQVARSTPLTGLAP